MGRRRTSIVWAQKIGQNTVVRAFLATTGDVPRRADMEMVRIMGGTAFDLLTYLVEHWRVKRSLAKKVVEAAVTFDNYKPNQDPEIRANDNEETR